MPFAGDHLPTALWLAAFVCAGASGYCFGRFFRSWRQARRLPPCRHYADHWCWLYQPSAMCPPCKALAKAGRCGPMDMDA